MATSPFHGNDEVYPHTAVTSDTDIGRMLILSKIVNRNHDVLTFKLIDPISLTFAKRV